MTKQLTKIALLAFTTIALIGCGQLDGGKMFGKKDNSSSNSQSNLEDTQRSELISEQYKFKFSSDENSFALAPNDKASDKAKNKGKGNNADLENNDDNDGTDPDEDEEKGKKNKDEKENLDDEVDEADTADAKKCGEDFPNSSKFVKVTGNQTTYDASLEAVYVIRLSGNQNVANLHFGAIENEEVADPDAEPVNGEGEGEDEKVDAEVAGVCFILAGNSSQVNLSLYNSKVGAISIRSRGNAPTVNISADDKSEIVQVNHDFKGNSGAINMSGKGKYSCDTQDEKELIINCD